MYAVVGTVVGPVVGLSLLVFIHSYFTIPFERRRSVVVVGSSA